jgi:branched-chain amino acid transport system substrate-binding protein
MKKKSPISLILALLMTAALLAGCAGTGDTADTPPAPPSAPGESATPTPGSDSAPTPAHPEKTSIVIGGARPQSGVYTVFEETGMGPVYRMWIDEVNADGGIYVEEYGKKLPIELKIYDDTSDIGTMTRLMEKLILEDKVDFLLPPTSTAALFAAAPIADRYGYLLIGAEGGSSTLRESAAKYTRFFGPVNNSETQVPALVDLLVQQGVTSAYIAFIEDLHGTEYSGAAIPALAQAGIDVLGVKSVPPDIQDMSPILNSAKATGAQAFLLFAYPDQNILATAQSIGIGYNPDVFLLGPGGGFEFFKYLFGDPSAVEGVMSFGAWNEKSSPGAKEFLDKFLAKYEGQSEVSVDWWGHICYYASLQVLQQAIERAGTLDNTAIAEIIATEKFDTVMGQVWFEDNVMAAECFLGNVGQWIGGKFEVIDASDRRTAEPVFPKPAWPAQ